MCQFEFFVEEIEETVANSFVVIFSFIFMFLLNYMGQKITDYNSDIFFTA